MEKGIREQRFSHPHLGSRVIDWLLFVESLGVLITLEIKRTQFGLNYLWFATSVSPIEGNRDRWIESQRLKPLIFLAEAVARVPNSQGKDLDFAVENRAREIIRLLEDSSAQLSSEVVEKIDNGIRLGHWLYHREKSRKDNQDWYFELGINRATTLDYLNLQALGLKDYQKLLSEIDGDKPLTIRDRIAYARRHNWIPSPGHGSRTSQMNKILD